MERKAFRCSQFHFADYWAPTVPMTNSGSPQRLAQMSKISRAWLHGLSQCVTLVVFIFKRKENAE